MRKPLEVCCTHSNAAPYLEYDCPHQPRLIVSFYQESWRVSTIHAHNYEHEPRLTLSFCKYSLWNEHIHRREETGLVPISRTHHMRWGKDVKPRDGASYKYQPRESNGPVYGIFGAHQRPHANFFSYGGSRSPSISSLARLK